MKRIVFLAALLVVPVTVAAQTFNVDLSAEEVVPGPGAEDGSGLAVLTVSGTDVYYSILVSGVEDPTGAHVHSGVEGVSGEVVIDLEPSFVLGMAVGQASTDQGVADAIVANPSAYYLQVHSDEFPGGAVRGQLVGAEPPTFDLHFPVVAAISGQAGSFYRTDLRLLNRGEAAASVILEYYPAGAAGNGGPTATAQLSVDVNQQAVLDDVVADSFGVTDGRGAMVVRSTSPLLGYARIANDQRASGGGTHGQLVRGALVNEALRLGALPFLAHRDPASGEGFRGNLGWFNPNATPVELTLVVSDSSGAVLGEHTNTVAGLAQEQYGLGGLWPDLDELSDLYVTFSVAGAAGVFVYASVVDNVTGDAIFIAAGQD